MFSEWSTTSSSARRQRVAVAGVERRPHAAAAGEPVDDVVRDAVAVLLADLQVAGQVGVLRVVDDQVAEQQAGLLDVAPGLLDQLHQHGVGGPAQQTHPREHIVRRLTWRALLRFFHG